MSKQAKNFVFPLITHQFSVFDISASKEFICRMRQGSIQDQAVRAFHVFDPAASIQGAHKMALVVNGKCRSKELGNQALVLENTRGSLTGSSLQVSSGTVLKVMLTQSCSSKSYIASWILSRKHRNHCTRSTAQSSPVLIL